MLVKSVVMASPNTDYGIHPTQIGEIWHHYDCTGTDTRRCYCFFFSFFFFLFFFLLFWQKKAVKKSFAFRLRHAKLSRTIRRNHIKYVLGALRQFIRESEVVTLWKCQLGWNQKQKCTNKCPNS